VGLQVQLWSHDPPGAGGRLRLKGVSVKKRVVKIPPAYAGKRLDQVLAALFPDFSRTRLQQWMHEGYVWVDGNPRRNADKAKGGERVEIRVPPAPATDWAAQAIGLDIIYEDEHLLVISKPAGMVVHPGAGNPDRTLLNALLYHAPSLQAIARAGIVHRLDKETSGLLVVAKTEAVRLQLIKQLQRRELKREYLAVVHGVMIAGGEVEAPIGRHLRDRTRMTVSARGKPAVSRYRVRQRYRAHTLVDVQLESGRTHQIRVHLAHIGYPLVGDPVYGGRRRISARSSEHLNQALRSFRRQALHAIRLSLVHPATEGRMQWSAPLPKDMQELIDVLEADVRSRPSSLPGASPRGG
jgi:23S rRNA pseudouridine1911/1915/1917 synthase